MDTILDMTKVFMSSVCFRLFPTDVACDNIFSIVTSPTKKIDHNEVHTIQDLLQCSRSSAYCQQRKASTKRGHLIAQVKNTSVKWYIKPCIVRTKKSARH